MPKNMYSYQLWTEVLKIGLFFSPTIFSQVTALMGAHTLGRAFKEHTGYEAPFTAAVGFGYNLFNTQYYKNLIDKSLEFRNGVSRIFFATLAWLILATVFTPQV